MTRFLDSNVFIYAFYKPRRHLTQLEKAMKDSSKKVIANMMEGKESLITTVGTCFRSCKHSETQPSCESDSGDNRRSVFS